MRSPPAFFFHETKSDAISHHAVCGPPRSKVSLAKVAQDSVRSATLGKTARSAGVRGDVLGTLHQEGAPAQLTGASVGESVRAPIFSGGIDIILGVFLAEDQIALDSRRAAELHEITPSATVYDEVAGDRLNCGAL